MEIEIPEKLAIYTDKRTGVKTIAFNIEFKDGIKGILSITKLVKMGWVPKDDLENITIKFR